MEKRIKEYETYIAKRTKNPDAKLVAYHREMLKNFQHERLIHLIIMLFFIALTLALTGILVFLLASTRMSYWTSFIPMEVATLIMWILSICYVKHYYFLENHVQALYNVSKELYENYANKNSIEEFGAEVAEVGKKIIKKVEKATKKNK